MNEKEKQSKPSGWAIHEAIALAEKKAQEANPMSPAERQALIAKHIKQLEENSPKLRYNQP